MIPVIEVDDLELDVELDYAIAEEFFGWKWMSYIDTPVRGTPGYPTQMRVRNFMSPKMLSDQRWRDYLVDRELRDADGTEPLDYCYCSSRGPAFVPHFSVQDVGLLEKELRRRKLWSQYRYQLWAQVSGRDVTDEETIDEEAIADADSATRCIAALAIVGSKHVGNLPA